MQRTTTNKIIGQFHEATSHYSAEKLDALSERLEKMAKDAEDQPGTDGDVKSQSPD